MKPSDLSPFLALWFFFQNYIFCVFFPGGWAQHPYCTALSRSSPKELQQYSTVSCIFRVFSHSWVSVSSENTGSFSSLLKTTQKTEKSCQNKGLGQHFLNILYTCSYIHAYVLIVKIISSLFRCIASSNWTYSVSNDLCQISYYRFMDPIKIDMRSTDINLSMQN